MKEASEQLRERVRGVFELHEQYPSGFMCQNVLLVE